MTAYHPNDYLDDELVDEDQYIMSLNKGTWSSSGQQKTTYAYPNPDFDDELIDEEQIVISRVTGNAGSHFLTTGMNSQNYDDDELIEEDQYPAHVIQKELNMKKPPNVNGYQQNMYTNGRNDYSAKSNAYKSKQQGNFQGQVSNGQRKDIYNGNKATEKNTKQNAKKGANSNTNLKKGTGQNPKINAYSNQTKAGNPNLKKDANSNPNLKKFANQYQEKNMNPRKDSNQNLKQTIFTEYTPTGKQNQNGEVAPNRKQNKFIIDRPTSTPVILNKKEYENQSSKESRNTKHGYRNEYYNSADNIDKLSRNEKPPTGGKSIKNINRDEIRATLSAYYSTQLGNTSILEVIEEKDDPHEEEDVKDILTPEERSYLENTDEHEFTNEELNKAKSVYGIKAEVPVHGDSSKLNVQVPHNQEKYNNPAPAPVENIQANPSDIVVGELPKIDQNSPEFSLSMIAKSLGVKIKGKNDTLAGRKDAESKEISTKDLVAGKLDDTPVKNVGNLRVRLNKNANMKNLLPRIKIDPDFESGPVPQPVEEPKPNKEMSRYLLGRIPEVVEDDIQTNIEPDFDPIFGTTFAPMNEGGAPVALKIGDFAKGLTPTKPAIGGTDPTKKPFYKYTAEGRAQIEAQKKLEEMNNSSGSKDGEDEVEIIEVIQKKRRPMDKNEMVNSAFITGIVFVLLLICFKAITAKL